MVDRRLCLEEKMDSFFFFFLNYFYKQFNCYQVEERRVFFIINFYNKRGNEDLNYGSPHKGDHSIPLNYKAFG